MNLPDDGIDRKPVDMGTVEIPLERMSPMSIFGMCMEAATLSQGGKLIATVLSQHGLGGLAVAIQVEDGGTYVLNLGKAMDSILDTILRYEQDAPPIKVPVVPKSTSEVPQSSEPS